MKRLLLYMMLVIVGCMTSCQKDFNEVEDSDQRFIIFNLHMEDLFSNILCKDNDAYFISVSSSLPNGYLVRVTAYCYDRFGKLVCSEKIFTPLQTECNIIMKHLQQGVTYQFVFIADVVKYKSEKDYYESWFQLKTEFWESLYLYADNRNDNAILDVLGKAVLSIQPNNQMQEVQIDPITYNGYCIFTNFEGVDNFSSYILYSHSFVVSTFKSKGMDAMAYTKDYDKPSEDIIQPVSLSYADNLVCAVLVTKTAGGIDTTAIDFPNVAHKPFVATYDCKNHKLVNCLFY